MTDGYFLEVYHEWLLLKVLASNPTNLFAEDSGRTEQPGEATGFVL